MKIKYFIGCLIPIANILVSVSCTKLNYLEPESVVNHSDTTFVFSRLSRIKTIFSNEKSYVVDNNTNVFYNKTITKYSYKLNNDVDSIIVSYYKDSTLVAATAKKYTFESNRIIKYEALELFPSFSKKVTEYFFNSSNKLIKISQDGFEKSIYYYSVNGDLDYILYADNSDSTDVVENDTSVYFTFYTADWIQLKKMEDVGGNKDIVFPSLSTTYFVLDSNSITGVKVGSTSPCGGCGNGSSGSIIPREYFNVRLPYPMNLNFSPILAKKWFGKDYFVKSSGSGAFVINYDYEIDKYGRVVKQVENSSYRGIENPSDSTYYYY